MHLDFSNIVILLIVALLLLGPKSPGDLARSVAEALSNFRGGPGSPSHPLPADDSRILNRKLNKTRKTD